MRCAYLRRALMIAAVAMIWGGHDTVRAFSTVPELIAQLSSSDWTKRSDAFTQLAASSQYLALEEVKQALITLLDQENQLIDSTLRASGGSVGVSSTLGEAYSEYYSKLIGTVESFANFSDQRTLQILARGSFNPDSPLARHIATRVDLVSTALIDLSRSDVAQKRKKAFAMMGQIVAVFKPPTLSPTISSQFVTELVAGVSDGNVAVQRQAVQSLKMLGDINSDGKADCTDVAIVRASFGKKTGQPGFDSRADVNDDGVVDVRDLSYVSQKLPAGTRCQ